MNKNIIGTILVIAITVGLGVLIAFSGGGPIETSKKTGKAEAVRADAYHKGNKDAKVQIVEFADFECPACKANSPIINEVANLYGSKIVFYYRHFPLSQHQFSLVAARAAEAAGKQGKFWEMHDKIFANQSILSNDLFYKLAKEIGLDETQFKKDMASKEIKDIVAKDKKDAIALGVNATPTFYLNGKKVEIYSVDGWKKAIDKVLGQ